jgi:hypothetical protein
MITEKQAAHSRAQAAGALALLTGGPVAASREMIEVYRLAAAPIAPGCPYAAEGQVAFKVSPF